MFRDGEAASRGPRLDRMGGLVLAMIAGVLVPVIGVLAVAAGSPVPRACSTGQATSTNLDGAILYSTGTDLWYSEGLPGRPRKLVDYSPPRARPTSGATPSASASAPALPSSSASPPPRPRPPPGRRGSWRPTSRPIARRWRCWYLTRPTAPAASRSDCYRRSIPPGPPRWSHGLTRRPIEVP